MLKKIKVKRLNIFEVLELAGKIYMKHFGLIAIIIFGAFLPVSIGLSIELLVITKSLSLPVDAIFNLEMLLFLILFVLVGTFSLVMLIQIVDYDVSAKRVEFNRLWKNSLSRFLPVVVSSILCGLAGIILCLFLLLPGIVFIVYSHFFLYAVVLRAKSGVDAIKYSFKLVHHNWWRVCGVSMLFWVLYEGVNFMVFSVLGISLVSLVILIIVMVFVMYYFEVAKIVVFLNLENLHRYIYGDLSEEEVEFLRLGTDGKIYEVD